MHHVRKVLSFVKPYRKLAVLALVFLAMRVAMDLSIPRLIEQIIDQGIKKNNLSVVLQTSGIMIVISLLDALVAIGNNLASVRVGQSVSRDIRESVFLKIQSFSYGNLDRFTTGKLMVRLTSDADAVQRWVQISLRIGTSAPLMMVGSLVLMITTNPHLALSMLPLLILTSAVILFFSAKMEPLFRNVQQKLDRLNTVLQENIAGARLVKAFARGSFENARFEDTNVDYTNQTINVMRFMATMSPVLTILVNMGLVYVVWAGGLQTIQGSMTVGQLVAFVNYLITTMNPLMMMANLSNTWANGLASARRIDEVLDAEIEVPEPAEPVSLPDGIGAMVDFEGVAFHYNGSSDGVVLESIDLKAEPGKTVAILGATGAGKSSLVNLIPRFYDPSSGTVKVGGRDVRTLSQDSLLSRIGIVPQETILFSGTVLDNIRYGRPDATEEEVINAAKAAQAHDFIMGLPGGYDAHIEERGANLSGGQKQRIAIARAVIMQPEILILDDSTSSVDIETETKIQAALELILQNRTCFVVAQRISTVLNADKIIILDKGRIAAEGTHAELIKSSPIYQEIYESQLGNGFREVNEQYKQVLAED